VRAHCAEPVANIIGTLIVVRETGGARTRGTYVALGTPGSAGLASAWTDDAAITRASRRAVALLARFRLNNVVAAIGTALPGPLAA
jgi:hypothetical protein